MSSPSLDGAPYDTVFSRIAEIVLSHAKGVAQAFLFGSVARGETQRSSDVDLLFVWPADIDEEDRWNTSREVAFHVDRITDRACFPLVYTEDEYRDLPHNAPRFAKALSEDAIDLLEYGSGQDSHNNM